MIRIYPNRASCERLLGSLLMEFDERMSTGKVYTDMASYRAWREAQGAVVTVDSGAASFAGKEGEILLKER